MMLLLTISRSHTSLSHGWEGRGNFYGYVCSISEISRQQPFTWKTCSEIVPGYPAYPRYLAWPQARYQRDISARRDNSAYRMKYYLAQDSVQDSAQDSKIALKHGHILAGECSSRKSNPFLYCPIIGLPNWLKRFSSGLSVFSESVSF